MKSDASFFLGLKLGASEAESESKAPGRVAIRKCCKLAVCYKPFGPTTGGIEAPGQRASQVLQVGVHEISGRSLGFF